ncbi:hypothetical protein [Endozoicomonas sp. SCSIO W0465]|uniref:hypothetical protein n=1 Tax=Endozoicomonas sp. SCSIO W0465 TaxID=2918516 RepID=UPI002075749A|nr:hypothetical protein [Endozoicomonas sp. SCSIO W0465]USE33822.1 hypothetical protein MJO57_16740 [Endozoicomonas sp. SCSIO W0465]
MTFGIDTINRNPGYCPSDNNDFPNHQEASVSAPFIDYRTCCPVHGFRSSLESSIPVVPGSTQSLPQNRSCEVMPVGVQLSTENRNPTDKANLSHQMLQSHNVQWPALLSTELINNALNSRPSNFNYDAIISKLSSHYRLNFSELARLCDGFSYSRSRVVRNPVEYYFKLFCGDCFRLLCKDSFLNLKVHLSELYLITHILQLEWSVIDPGLPPPVYCERSDENNISISNSSTARAIRSVFFLNLLVEMKRHERIGFFKELMLFINLPDNAYLKSDLLFLLNLLESGSDSERRSECDAGFSRELFTILNKNQSSEFGVFLENKEELSLVGSYIKKYQVDRGAFEAVMPSGSEPALTTSAITKVEIQGMEASDQIQLLMEKCKDRLGIDLSAMSKALVGLCFSNLLVKDPIKYGITDLPRELESCKGYFLKQQQFHASDRHAAFLLIWLLKAEMRVTGITSVQPQSYEATQNGGARENVEPPLISQNSTNLSEAIVKEFLQSLYRHLSNLERYDVRQELIMFCKNSGFESLLEESRMMESINHPAPRHASRPAPRQVSRPAPRQASHPAHRQEKNHIVQPDLRRQCRTTNQRIQRENNNDACCIIV